jgi:hypothetical protein
MKRLTTVGLLAALLLGGCDRGGGQPTRLTAELDYPVAHFDLQAQVTADQADAAVRQLAARIADTDGVAVAEADYAGHVIRVALVPGTAAGGADRIRAAVRGLSGVTGVEPAS